jgi:hypothetical protein
MYAKAYIQYEKEKFVDELLESNKDREVQLSKICENIEYLNSKDIDISSCTKSLSDYLGKFMKERIKEGMPRSKAKSE